MSSCGTRVKLDYSIRKYLEYLIILEQLGGMFGLGWGSRMKESGIE